MSKYGSAYDTGIADPDLGNTDGLNSSALINIETQEIGVKMHA